MNSQREAFEKVYQQLMDLPSSTLDGPIDTPHNFAKTVSWAVWQAATEQGVGEAVAWQTEIHAYDPPAICTHGSLRSAKAYQEGAGIDRCGIVPLYRHPPKPTGGVVPDGFVLMPVALTAENGAKSALMGEFSESITLPCPDCEIYDTDQGDGHCPVCGDSGDIEQKVAVSWSTIKDIYTAAVSLLATQQPPEQD